MNIEGKRVAYVTLGCKLNFSETSTIKHSLEEEDAITVGEKDGADIFIINTCSVTDMAEKKGRQLIRKIIGRNPDAFIVVVGCYAQLRAKELMAIKGVGLVLGANEKFNVKEFLKHVENRNKIEPHSCDVFKIADFDLAYSYGDRTRCFLKIQDGCNYFCTYCTIPFARGKSRSATIAQIVDAVKKVAEKGIKEVILTGVNTGDFGAGNNETFLELIQILDGLPEMERFRISSIEPNLLTDEIIEFVAHSKRFMPHFHIPLQSGSNDVLQLMKRKYKREVFAEKVHKIRSLIPDAFIGVDVIAGMRGETQAFFDDNLDFIKSLAVSQLHVFPYSERSGTKALEIPLAVTTEDKHQRVEAIIEVSNQKLSDFYHKYIGTTHRVLFEDNNHGGMMHGFTDNYIKVELPYNHEWVNTVQDVELTADNIKLETL